MTGQAKPRKSAAKPKKSAGFGSNLEAIRAMIEALADAGRLEKVDSARVQIALHLARQVDDYPENVGLWQQYRAAEQLLREVTDDSDDGLADLFRAFDAEVRNAENRKPPKPRK